VNGQPIGFFLTFAVFANLGIFFQAWMVNGQKQEGRWKGAL
jgi:hypothetical protein